MRKTSHHYHLNTARIAVDSRTSGFLVDPTGRVALVHRGEGVACSPSAEECVELIRGLHAVLPALARRDAALGDDVLAELEAISDARH